MKGRRCFQEEAGRLVLEVRNYEALFALWSSLSHFSLEQDLLDERAPALLREEPMKEYLLDVNALLRFFGAMDAE